MVNYKVGLKHFVVVCYKLRWILFLKFSYVKFRYLNLIPVCNNLFCVKCCVSFGGGKWKSKRMELLKR